MDIRPIRTPKDLAWGLAEIEKAMSSPVLPGTADGDRLEVLITLVHAYEQTHHPIPSADPIEAIKFRMEQAGLTTTDLLSVFGTRGRASEILQRRRRLSLGIMRAIHNKLGIPLEVLARDYKLKAASRVRRRDNPSRAKRAKKATSRTTKRRAA
jgi:HTH-type transcriptional regulator/antitoxin HigA